MLNLSPLVLLVSMLLPPAPGGLGADFSFLVWQGALPWSLPSTPSTSVSLSVPSISGPTNTTGYSDNIDDLTTEFDAWKSKLDGMDSTVATLESTIGAPGSQGDYDPGLQPDGSPTTVYGMIDGLAVSVGTVLGYARAFKALNFNSSGGFFSFLLLAFAWVFFNLTAKTVLGFIMRLLNWVWKLWEAIPFVN